ncbi:MAG TPA: 1,4-alpha-glucan branching protein GlgB [Desulfobacteraceae bacterium]|nr:1,4-alpha-glucan branching protein GlgB [Desulfobacteraceae bacterium]
MGKETGVNGGGPGENINQKSLVTDDDVYLFNEGSHFRLYEKLGAHPVNRGDESGVCFGVWAPNAEGVSVIGSFNDWRKDANPLQPKGESGVWERYIPGVVVGDCYKFHVRSRFEGYIADKLDPFAFYSEKPPRTGSVVWDLKYQWEDEEWMSRSENRLNSGKAVSIYEVHAGSWMRHQEDNRPFSYRELAEFLPDYAADMGFTHVEFLPVMEHPFYGSWGYQCLGYFAPTSRYGTPQDFMYLVDCLHRRGIGVILDWVPSHFPTDGHGLGYFDGTHLYEHSDPRQGIHPDWDSFIFNYGRNEVRSFLMSSAFFWLDKYHADGLRVDAVASMLYLNYSRKDGEWIPNRFGGNESLEAIDFIRRFNSEIYSAFPGVQTVAEESTSWPMVSRPTYVGGLGFGMKWDMGWMHDTLSYMSIDPIYRTYHHDKLTFRMLYAFHENFVLSLSHDEVVHGKGSLIRKMPGDDWRKFANLRLLFAWMYAQPGKKLVFMGGEFGQWNEWYHEKGLDWDLTKHPLHHGIKRWVSDLNRAYREEPALHRGDFDPAGFSWIDCNDSAQSVISLMRKDPSDGNTVLVVLNFTPVPRHNYRVGCPGGGSWMEILNGDAAEYGGSGQGNTGGVEAAPIPFHGLTHSLSLTVPPLAAVFLKGEANSSGKPSGRNRMTTS